MMTRAEHQASSNNQDNTNKNWCALKVAEACGVADKVRYLHTWGDMKRAMQTKYSFRSNKSSHKAKTVSQFMKSIKTNPDPRNVLGYVMMVDGHVMLASRWGEMVVDTDPRKSDRRVVREFYAIKKK
jgi:hypothetical protein